MWGFHFQIPPVNSALKRLEAWHIAPGYAGMSVFSPTKFDDYPQQKYLKIQV